LIINKLKIASVKVGIIKEGVLWWEEDGGGKVNYKRITNVQHSISNDEVKSYLEIRRSALDIVN
jgi:hypothetical protein